VRYHPQKGKKEEERNGGVDAGKRQPDQGVRREQDDGKTAESRGKKESQTFDGLRIRNFATCPPGTVSGKKYSLSEGAREGGKEGVVRKNGLKG